MGQSSNPSAGPNEPTQPERAPERAPRAFEAYVKSECQAQGISQEALAAWTDIGRTCIQRLLDPRESKEFKSGQILAVLQCLGNVRPVVRAWLEPLGYQAVPCAPQTAAPSLAVNDIMGRLGAVAVRVSRMRYDDRAEAAAVAEDFRTVAELALGLAARAELVAEGRLRG